MLCPKIVDICKILHHKLIVSPCPSRASFVVSPLITPPPPVHLRLRLSSHRLSPRPSCASCLAGCRVTSHHAATSYPPAPPPIIAPLVVASPLVTPPPPVHLRLRLSSHRRNNKILQHSLPCLNTIPRHPQQWTIGFMSLYCS